MVRDPKLLAEFEHNYLSRCGLDISRNFRIQASLYEQARNLGVIPSDDPLAGFENDLKLAKILNSVRSSS